MFTSVELTCNETVVKYSGPEREQVAALVERAANLTEEELNSLARCHRDAYTPSEWNGVLDVVLGAIEQGPGWPAVETATSAMTWNAGQTVASILFAEAFSWATVDGVPVDYSTAHRARMYFGGPEDMADPGALEPFKASDPDGLPERIERSWSDLENNEEGRELLNWVILATSGAMHGLVTRGFIEAKTYDALTYSWARVIGPVHPDDAAVVPDETAAKE